MDKLRLVRTADGPLFGGVELLEAAAEVDDG